MKADPKQIGNLILQLRTGSERASRPEITIVCNDIGEINTKEKVREVLEEQFDLIESTIGISQGAKSARDAGD